MITRQQIKFLQSLQQKKIRRETGLFLAEGAKIVPELLQSAITIKEIYAVPEFISQHRDQLSGFLVHPVDETELQRISALTTANEVVAVAEIPSVVTDFPAIAASLSLYLDNIRDPGNLGTIIRIADWFGISDVVCSPGCAETWNPKTVQATMASLARVRIHTIEANVFFPALRETGISCPVYGTFLEGESIYKTTFPKNGVVIIGNESNGIGEETSGYVTNRITIPSYALAGKTGEAESLNAAIATAVTVAEIRRQQG